jgi:hypothetical protein
LLAKPLLLALIALIIVGLGAAATYIVLSNSSRFFERSDVHETGSDESNKDGEDDDSESVLPQVMFNTFTTESFRGWTSNGSAEAASVIPALSFDYPSGWAIESVTAPEHDIEVLSGRTDNFRGYNHTIVVLKHDSNMKLKLIVGIGALSGAWVYTDEEPCIVSNSQLGSRYKVASYRITGEGFYQLSATATNANYGYDKNPDGQYAVPNTLIYQGESAFLISFGVVDGLTASDLDSAVAREAIDIISSLRLAK